MHKIPDDRHLHLMGDYHKYIGRLQDCLKALPSRSTVVCLGDYDAHEAKDLVELEELVRPYGVEMFLMRGNHDHPKYWQNPALRETLSEGCITLLDDVDCLMWNGIKLVTVSGAVSVDRTCIRNDRGECWPDEEQIPSDVILRVQNLAPCDILLTHTGNPGSRTGKSDFIDAYASTDEYLERDMARERQVIQKLQIVSGCSHHYYGHFHMSHAEEQWGIQTRCLDICELMEIKQSL